MFRLKETVLARLNSSCNSSLQNRVITLLGLLFLIVAAVLIWALLFRPGGLADAYDWNAFAKVGVKTAILLLAGWISLGIVFRRQTYVSAVKSGPAVPYTPADYISAGLGPKPAIDARELYIDLMKRCVANILYEDQPVMFYDGQDGPKRAAEFDLQRRIDGRDMPSAAHTMIGMHRLDNIQQCFEQVLKEDVLGDIAETGSYRGGGTIFIRALMKAYGVTDRKVFVCDAFMPMEVDLPPRIFFPLLRAVASIPGTRNKRRLYRFLERLPQRHRAFPLCEDPSADWIDLVLWTLRHPETIGCNDATSRAHVESRFARYGLFDDQVVFVEGFFAESLPKAPIKRLAILRLDGDTFESTWDAITNLYPLLSPGGFCIVDDYYAFKDCKRAIDRYREDNHISEPVQDIDGMGVYWRRNLSNSGN